jgi:hypothetical protein
MHLPLHFTPFSWQMADGKSAVRKSEVSIFPGRLFDE